MASLSHIAKDTIRVLTFRQPSAEISNSWKSYLAFGLFFTWVAGIGRYWDNPKAGLWQHLGLGSVVYVFILAWVLRLLIVLALTLLNLEHVVFNIMGGIRPEDRSPNDSAYLVVMSLTILSVYSAPFLILMYAVFAYLAQRNPRHSKCTKEDETTH